MMKLSLWQKTSFLTSGPFSRNAGGRTDAHDNTAGLRYTDAKQRSLKSIKVFPRFPVMNIAPIFS